MPDWKDRNLPYEDLIAWQVARELLLAVKAANIADSKLRDQAMRAAQSTCLNIAEATGGGNHRGSEARLFHCARRSFGGCSRSGDRCRFGRV
jgi:four helix bundle protein